MSRAIFLMKFLKVELGSSQLPQVIKFSIGCATQDKITKVIQSYNYLNNEIIGAFREDNLIGIIGLLESVNRITIRHISIIPEFRRKNIGNSLLHYIKNHYNEDEISVETDEESV
ncbi:MAG: GNAT family N-acetyltransferase, partial [Sphingobacteriaceae bacterium]